VYERNPWREVIAGARGKPPRFVLLLLATLALGILAGSFVELRPLLEWLRLDARVWEEAQLWRLVTYGLVGDGVLSLWSLLQLVAIGWFTVELCVAMGVARVRMLVLGGIAISGLVAVVAEIAWELTGGVRSDYVFEMAQGQRIVVAIIVPAFGTRHRHTMLQTPLLFGLPLPSRWLIGLQLVLALATFAALRDVGGFAGVLAATLWGARALRKR
jgi:hypothetical protein